MTGRPIEGEDGWVEGGDARRPLQPADPADLERFPAETPACRATRARLRDYVDGDLPPALVRAIDEHVHGCRSCSLALARAEHEVMLFRDALDGRSQRVHSKGERFENPRLVRSIVARAAAELAIDEDRRVKRRARRTLRPAGVGAFAVVALAVLFGIYEAVSTFSGPESASARTTVILAQEASLFRVGGSAAPESIGVGPSSALDQGGLVVETGPAGSLAWQVQDGGVEPRSFALGGRGQVHLKDQGDLRLSRGELELRTWTGTTVELGPEVDGGRALGQVRTPSAGDEVVLSLWADEVAQAGASERRSEWNRLPRLRVEVLRASSPVRFEAGDESVELREGEVAALDPGRRLSIEPGLSAAAVLASLNASRNIDPGPGALAAAGPRLTVLDRRGEPLVGAVVGIDSTRGPSTTRTDRNGEVALPEGDRLLVEVRPPLGSGASSFVPRLIAGEDTTWTMPVESSWEGRVSRRDGGGLRQAQLMPLLVDELLGRVEALEWLRTESSATGEFVLRRLPVKLLPYQRVVVQVTDPDTGRSFLAEVPRESADRDVGSALENGLIVPEGRELQIGSLPSQGFVEFVEELPGVSIRTAGIWHRRRPDSSGSVSLQTWGEGRVWIVRDGRLFGLTNASGAAAQAGAGLLVPDSEPSGSDSLLKRLRSVARPYESGSSLAFAEGRRQGTLHRTDAADRRQVVAYAGQGAVEENAVYLERADGRLEVVGRGSRFTPFVDEPTERPYRVFAVGADGSIGRREILGDELAEFWIQTEAPGRVRWPEGENVPRRIELVALGGWADRLSFVQTARSAGSLFGPVPAGQYEIRVDGERVGEVAVEAGAQVVADLD